MADRTREIEHCQTLLAQHRRNAQMLREQLAIYPKGTEPLDKLTQLADEQGAIREAKAALHSLGVQVDQLPGDPEEEAEAGLVEKESKDSQPETYPRINASAAISFTTQERTLLQHLFRDSGLEEVLVEKEFGGGYSGTRVLLALPIRADGRGAARKVTKLGSALELRRERDNYEQHVEAFLPFCAARVDRYCELGDQAGLNYVFVGGGALGRVVDLEEYYRKHPAKEVVQALDALLNKALGQRWYRETTPLHCFFAAEYGRHMVEHLRLRLRPASSDALWPEVRPRQVLDDYRRIEIGAIRQEYGTIHPGTILSVEGLIVTRIKPGEVKLQDPGGGLGVVVRAEFMPQSNAAQGLELDDRVGVRGQVVYNRRDRMEQIVRAIFPDLSPGIDSQLIELPGIPETYPNPLKAYPRVLSETLESGRSYVHGDLHLRNVLIDESGRGWLIDFARVEKRHNLFDFVKLETYVRLMRLASVTPLPSMSEYVHFERALNDATLVGSVRPPDNPHLLAAYQIILAIRRIARDYMGPEPSFEKEYFPSLFLYSLAVLKYHQDKVPQPTRLAFATACVLGQYILGSGDQVRFQTPTVAPGPLSTGPRLATGVRWAVMAGINTYKDHNISNLTCCVADVQSVHRLLASPARGAYRSRLLLDTIPGLLPSRNNILTELANVAQAADKGDLLLFYFSGHGAVEAGEAYLIPRDARPTNLTDTAVPLRRVKDIMAGSAARAKVIILDACHSGARIGKTEARMSPEFMQRVFAEAEGLIILGSCQQGQVSYEWEQAGQSVFTHYLLEGLTGAADFDGKGFVTIQDINRYVVARVKRWAVEHGRLQTPMLGGGWSGDVVIVDY